MVDLISCGGLDLVSLTHMFRVVISYRIKINVPGFATSLLEQVSLRRELATRRHKINICCNFPKEFRMTGIKEFDFHAAGMKVEFV
jgi:hypothetical protein